MASISVLDNTSSFLYKDLAHNAPYTDQDDHSNDSSPDKAGGSKPPKFSESCNSR